MASVNVGLDRLDSGSKQSLRGLHFAVLRVDPMQYSLLR